MSKQKVLLDKSIDLLLSSDTKTGAVNLSENNSSFEVNFNPSFGLPKDAVNPRLSVEAASVWFVNPNVSSSNNQLIITKAGVPQTITIPTGLYSLSDLSLTCMRLTSSLGFNTNGIPAFEFSPCSGTNKVELIINALDVEVEFTNASPTELLGFNVQKIGVPSYLYQIFLGDNEAQINNINSFHLHSSLVESGISVGSTLSQCIANIPITSQAGGLIHYDPLHSPKINCDNLIGAKLSTIRCWLTSEANQAISMRNETFDFRVKIQYQQPYEF